MKGWGSSYASWQLIGGSTTSTHENLYFRSGLGSAWNTTRTILHSGNWSSTITLTSLGYSGATNANYITNNNQLTNGAGYITDGNTNWNNSYGFVTSSGVTSVATGGGLTGGTITSTGTLSHADTSSQASLTALTGANVVSDIDLDTYGHVTNMATRTMTLANLGYTGATNANYITNNNQLTNGSGYTTYSANQALDTGSAPTFNTLYLNSGWFRNTGDSGMYNSSDLNHFYSDSTAYWCMDSDNGLIFRDGHNGTPRGYVFWDGSDFGLMSQGGSWRVKCVAETSVQIKSVDLICDADVIAFSSSDRKFKDNLKAIEEPIEKIKKLTGYTFTWNELQNSYIGEDVGVVAQEVNEVLPEVVTERDDGYLAVKYEKMIPLLIEAMKEQQDQIDELTKQIEELKNDNTN
jgi:hypothetical protein